MSDLAEYTRRLDGLLRQYLGAGILEALADPDIEEIYVNPDMVVRLVSHQRGRVETGDEMREADVTQFLRAVATINAAEIGEARPSLQAVLPGSFGKCRLQGFIPPLSEGPSLIIRKPPGRIIPLDEYVEQGILTERGKAFICRAVTEHKNIMVAGPTASGKTTLCNAIIDEIARQFSAERLLILEDTPELHCSASDHLRLRTTDTVTMRHLVKYSLRCTPNRIIIGEVRDGAAKDLLDAWITGHPGGCGTIHGEDCERALQRLSELAREGAGGVAQHRMVAQAVHYLILITGHGTHRKVTDIVRIMGSEGSIFQLEQVGL